MSPPNRANRRTLTATAAATRRDAWALPRPSGPDLLVLSSATERPAWRIPDVAAVVGSLPTT